MEQRSQVDGPKGALLKHVTHVTQGVGVVLLMRVRYMRVTGGREGTIGEHVTRYMGGGGVTQCYMRVT